MENKSHRLKCSVNGCGNKQSQGFSLHSLPKISDLKRRSSWIKLLQIDVENLRSRFVVCSEHFIPGDFHPAQNEFQKARFLRSRAVPSQNLPRNVYSTDIEMELGEIDDSESFREEQLRESVDLTDNFEIPLIDEPSPEFINSHINSQQEYIQFLLKHISFQQAIIKDLVENNNKVSLYFMLSVSVYYFSIL